ncbi:MAG: helix-turn-helix transcriptional regulator [Oscillatoriales cyanobacterium C42_A2020_001]|nr:helix-turn-helix transcriptional regulator [Leptolyngbyaceae cyanobacterium C42_A2020_001]
MSETQPLTIDFTQEDEVLQILPRPALRSSANLGWNGIYVQQHWQPAWETPEYAHTRHMLLIHNPNVTIQAERSFDGRRQQEQFGGGNNIVIVPATVLHQANWNQESPFSLLFVEPDYLIQVARESVTTDRVQLTAQFAMHDPLIHQIGRSLTAELETNQLHSRLFVDSLTTALSIHLLRDYSDWQQPLREDTNGLPQRKLQQAIAYINENLVADLTIREIADELEMSQYYFSRLFKQSTGVSPYQYVMQQRIERAKYLLRTTSLSVAAIALQTGFSNQNQLTIQFRKFTGTTPSGYRKQL